PAAPSSPPTTAAASTEPPPVTPTATAEPTPTPEPETTAPQVLLSGTAVGDVVEGTADALPLLEGAFGPADSTDQGLGECGPPSITFAKWGDLWVSLDDGALFGWQLRGPAMPTVATLPQGVPFASTYAAIAALPGVGAPGYLDNYQVHTLTVDGVTWWFDTDAADSPTVMVGNKILGCG
ncbi:MAG: hypothetical protein HGA44_20845, partial [Cellulomonadaceae bacterium]|nr:hypothetical protein [Cellulomonadaceae bacterium]